ncbi:MAG: multidrug efflux SMR transporter [Gemmataceae bacterium]|nr:multidrug efflux SMR transporter [Gemmataceae bacterium]
MTPMQWVYLVIAGLFEIGFATLLKLSNGVTRFWPTVGFLSLGCLSLWFLSLAMKEIDGRPAVPLGTAYAVWTGIGACGTAVVGALFFRDPLTPGRLFFLSLLLIGFCGLNYLSRHEM